MSQVTTPDSAAIIDAKRQLFIRVYIMVPGQAKVDLLGPELVLGSLVSALHLTAVVRRVSNQLL